MAQATVLTQEDVKRVLAVIAAGRHAERNRIAFLLSVRAGMRVGEIAALTCADVVRSDGSVTTEIKLRKTQTKGHKGRIVYLNDKLRSELAAYIGGLKKLDATSPLISSQRNARAFTATTLCILFRKLYARAGLQNSSHAGRRTFATTLNAKGVGMRTIQRLMGHEHISTTAIYCDVNDETLRNAVKLV